MKVAVIGSRKLNLDISPFIPKGATVLLSGGAKGIDTLAEEYAAAHGIPIQIFLPDYKTYGRAAPLVRNRLIVDSADEVIAIWDGKSKGTDYVIGYAEKRGVRLHLVQVVKASPTPKKKRF